MVPITWDKIGMKNLTKRSFFSTSTKTVPIKKNPLPLALAPGDTVNKSKFIYLFP